MGRIWRTQDIVDWAVQRGRAVNMPTEQEPRRTKTVRTSPVHSYTAGALISTPTTPVTISSGEEPVVEEHQVAQVDTGVKKQTPSESVVENPPDDPEPPSRRTTQELNKIALAEDWDTLERIYEAAKKNTELPESEIQLVGFAVMVIASQANVPNYRRTKDSMVRAWNEVRRAYEPTVTELVSLAQHVVATAQTPFTPGAVKKFSDFEIAKLRRSAARPQEGRLQSNRWQGAHGSHEEAIAKMTPEERKRWGIK